MHKNRKGRTGCYQATPNTAGNTPDYTLLVTCINVLVERFSCQVLMSLVIVIWPIIFWGGLSHAK